MNVRTVILAVLLSATVIRASELTKTDESAVLDVKQAVLDVQKAVLDVQPNKHRTVKALDSKINRKSNLFGGLELSSILKTYGKLLTSSGFPFPGLPATDSSHSMASILPTLVNIGLTSGLTSAGANIFRSYLGAALTANSRPHFGLHAPGQLANKFPFPSLSLPKIASPFFPAGQFFSAASGLPALGKHRGGFPAFFSPKNLLASKLKMPHFGFPKFPKDNVNWQYVKPRKVKYLPPSNFGPPMQARPNTPLPFFLPPQQKLPNMGGQMNKPFGQPFFFVPPPQRPEVQIEHVQLSQFDDSSYPKGQEQFIPESMFTESTPASELVNFYLPKQPKLPETLAQPNPNYFENLPAVPDMQSHDVQVNPDEEYQYSEAYEPADSYVPAPAQPAVPKKNIFVYLHEKPQLPVIHNIPERRPTIEIKQQQQYLEIPQSSPEVQAKHIRLAQQAQFQYPKASEQSAQSKPNQGAPETQSYNSNLEISQHLIQQAAQITDQQLSSIRLNHDLSEMFDQLAQKYANGNMNDYGKPELAGNDRSKTNVHETYVTAERVSPTEQVLYYHKQPQHQASNNGQRNEPKTEQDENYSYEAASTRQEEKQAQPAQEDSHYPEASETVMSAVNPADSGSEMASHTSMGHQAVRHLSQAQKQAYSDNVMEKLARQAHQYASEQPNEYDFTELRSAESYERPKAADYQDEQQSAVSKAPRAPSAADLSACEALAALGDNPDALAAVVKSM
ncbi:hypothetical protein HDE_06846 [Halotydeus destructor]|nr:hypothetical protein HDE_06846 [Halotydeus destructor]